MDTSAVSVGHRHGARGARAAGMETIRAPAAGRGCGASRLARGGTGHPALSARSAPPDTGLDLPRGKSGRRPDGWEAHLGMMDTRPHSLARPGLVAVAVLAVASACTGATPA